MDAAEFSGLAKRQVQGLDALSFGCGIRDFGL